MTCAKTASALPATPSKLPVLEMLACEVVRNRDHFFSDLSTNLLPGVHDLARAESDPVLAPAPKDVVGDVFWPA